MTFSIDFLDDGRVLEWEATTDGAVASERDDYTPRFYVASRDPETDLDLTTLQSVYDQHPDVIATEMVARRPGFLRDKEAVLAFDVAHIDRVTPLARQARQLSDFPVGDLACFNVDFSREFRYCLENSVNPTSAGELSTLRLSVPMTEMSNDVYGELSIADDLRSLAADRGYDAKAFRDELRENGVRPLIKHRIMNPLDHAHNARMDRDRYNRRSMNETVFSSIKRTHGCAERARH